MGQCDATVSLCMSVYADAFAHIDAYTASQCFTEDDNSFYMFQFGWKVENFTRRKNKYNNMKKIMYLMEWDNGRDSNKETKLVFCTGWFVSTPSPPQKEKVEEENGGCRYIEKV